MKKIIIIISIISAILIGKNVLATVVTERRINKPQTNTHSSQTTYTGGVSKDFMLAENIRSCKPYKERLSTDYMGMKFNYTLDIAGWVNGKCRVDFEAKTDGACLNFEEIYGIPSDSANISVYAPKIRCEFSQNQLDFVGDSILQEQERNAQNSKMLKNPNNISFSGISGSDLKLLDVILRQRACSILNTEDLNQIMNELFGY